jgi:hypothetical protein
MIYDYRIELGVTNIELSKYETLLELLDELYPYKGFHLDTLNDFIEIVGRDKLTLENRKKTLLNIIEENLPLDKG